MNVNWFFYNFSTSTDGIHTPVIESVTSVLGEDTSTIETVARLNPKKITSNPIVTYLWLPVLGGTGYDGCYLYNELLIDGNWIKNENSVIELDKLNKLKNTGMAMPTLKDKIFSLGEWTNFGICPSRTNLYIPTGKSVTDFFFGLKKVDY